MRDDEVVAVHPFKVVQVSGHIFLFWTGETWVTASDQAKVYDDRASAEADAKRLNGHVNGGPITWGQAKHLCG